ncbi:hypothetical protein F0243_20410 [Vibrio mediterranei]|nr:hypothetical protein [Vibrio mediterranei]
MQLKPGSHITRLECLLSIQAFKSDSQRMVLFIPSLGSVFKVVRFSGSVAHYLTRRCTPGKQNGKYLRFSDRGSH